MSRLRGRGWRVAAFPAHGHPSDRVLRAMVAALESAGIPVVRQSELAGKALLRVGFVPRTWGGDATLLPMMGQQWWRLARAAASEACVVYAWDVWEPDLNAWAQHLERRRVRGVITSSSQAAQGLRAAGVRAHVLYLPEAVALERFPSPERLAHRSIDCLEIGRRDEDWHESVTPGLARAGYRHLFERRPGETVFPTESGLDEGFLDAKVLICLPRSRTHPDSAGAFDVLTQRYLEGMAAGCLLLGEAPTDLVRLYGYDPVVPLDREWPLRQIMDIIDNISTYQTWVDRNRARTAQVGSWLTRAPELIASVDAVLARRPGLAPKIGREGACE